MPVPADAQATAAPAAVQPPEAGRNVLEGESSDAEPHDNLVALQDICVSALANDESLMNKIRGSGAAWGSIKALFLRVLPQDVDDRSDLAYQMVRTALSRLFGEQNRAWHSFKNPERGNTAYVKAGPNPSAK
jgi:hypothetical protein